MPARYPITNFSRGEFGPQLYGRVDIPQYTAGAKQLKNFIVQRYGGARFREGFRFVAPIMEPDLSKAVKLVPFQYSIDQAYVHVMRDNRMNVAARGGMVLEENLKIESKTNGATTLLNVKFHGFAVGDWVYLDGNTGPAGLNGRFAKVTQVVDQHNIRVDIDSTGFSALSASTGVSRSGVPAAPPPPEPPPPAPLPPPPLPDTGSGGGTLTVDTGGAGGEGGLQGNFGAHGYYAIE